MKKTRLAVIGCGKISGIYLQNLCSGKFPNVEAVACCDLNEAAAKARAEEFGVEARSMEDILADPTISMVIVLTPAPSHYGLIKQALLAGKHVYTEKTMTHELGLARELVQLAKEKGAYLGAAPDTFLGAANQRARQLVDSGELGEVTSFHIHLNRCLDRMLCLYPFLRLPAGGICYDMGVYYLTALVNLLGPVREVCAVVENRKPVRTNQVEGTADFGQSYEYNNEAQISALIRTESGITGTFTLNGETIGFNQHQFALYGTKGILQLPDPNTFGGDVTLIRGKDDVQVLDNELPYGDNSRGIGPADMAAAIAAGKQNRASCELALHVLDIIESMVRSTQTGCFVQVESTCQRPAPMQK